MKLICCIALALTTTTVLAQQEEAAVNTVLKTMFDGMYEGDSAKVHSVFAKSITMATIFRDKTGSPLIRQETSLDGFLKAIGTPHAEKWTEEFWNVSVQIDGDFAQAWCDYAFYVNHTFSHCGVDAFHLHKTNAGWKIFHLADTRRKDNCNIPEEMLNKHK
jgi:hypothetical protein